MVPNKIRPETSSRLTEVPPGLQQQQTLSPELLKTVASWALKAEKHFGSPQNMEWAISGDRFYILQSRAIASIAHKSRSLEPRGKYVLFKPAINNGATAPFTPLTTDLMSLAAAPLLRPIHGHCYLNLKYLRALLPFKISDRELVDLVAGLSPEQPEQPLTQQKLSLSRLLLSLPLWLGGYFLFGVFFARTRNMPENFSEQYKDRLRSEDQNSSKNPLNKLLRLSLLPKLFDPIGSVPLWLNIASVRHLFFFIPLKNFIAHRLPTLHAETSSLFRIKRNHRPYPEAMQTAIEQLTLKAGQFPAIREQFFKRPPEQVIHALKKNPNARPFLQLFTDFIEQQGYRATQELELQSVRWEENPNHVIKLIREHLLHPPEKSEEYSP
ncbi:MAG: hypothetical protein D3908_12425, partial [Candidatus Electrothrix sp. AUS4]|nr:hypothetical protein [Candidatus Electrothrix sp. AUS4]